MPAMSQEHVHAAVVQAASVAFDPQKTLTKATELATKAAAQGADLILFPEAFLSGYPRGMGFDTVVGARTEKSRDLFLDYWNSAIEIPGPENDHLAALAADLSAYLVMGCVERDGGTLYCTILYYSPDQGLLGKHRKVMPTASERLIWGYGDGSDLDVYQTPIGNLGGAVCWENYMPLLRMSLYQQDIQIWCAPTADARDSWTASMRHIAVEGRCFVLGANQYATRSDYPESYDSVFGDDPETLVTRGASCIVDPFGRLLAGPHTDGETILLAELDLRDTVRGRFDLDVAGHYSRGEIFEMRVRTRPA
ncbi:MAG: carbon-nitrogen hydrolase family protein [bacterium]|nr:carbon-nitrogen hydrolase family protein [bacterium]